MGALHRYLCGALAIALPLLPAMPARAWMNDGHEIVADIAAKNLSPKARAAVDELLARQELSTMAQASGWADVVRYVPGIRQPSHVVRLPLDGSAYDPERDCRARRCPVAAVEAYAATLADPDASMAEKVVALNFVIHLVGDLHQPLHASADTGNRIVDVDGDRLRLHDLWDDLIVRHRGRTPSQLAEEIAAGSPCRPEPESGPADWAMEGRDIARDAIFADPRLGGEGVPKLGADYLDENWRIVRERLQKAGCRLAGVLNGALGQEMKTKDDVGSTQSGE